MILSKIKCKLKCETLLSNLILTQQQKKERKKFHINKLLL